MTKQSAETWDRLTCSYNPLNLNAGGVQLLGKLMDSSIGVFIGFRVNVRFGAWKFNCRRVRGLLLRLNMHTAHHQALDRQTITEGGDSEGIAKQSADGKHLCQKVFHTGKFITKETPMFVWPMLGIGCEVVSCS